MNFGQMLAALLNGNSVTRDGLERQSTLQAVQTPTGMLTEPFIVQRFSNGECSVYTPTQGDIFATNWSIASDGAIAGQGSHAATQAVQEREHAGAR